MGKTNLKNHSLGVQGVPLKHFEKVVKDILPSIEPRYTRLPPKIEENDEWPFHHLPKAARVWGENPGQLKNKARAARKEGQIQSILRCVLRLIDETKDSPFTIVDFGGGSGHLGLPLALLLPTTTVIVVDLRKFSLDLMHEKAGFVVEEICQSQSREKKYQKNKILDELCETNQAFRCCGKNGILENLYSFDGPVEDFIDIGFDLAIALHLCGEATDVAVRRAAAQGASIVAAPCCVGKLSTKAMNPDIFNATGSNEATVNYPQSTMFCQLIKERDDWNALAKAADYSNESENKTHRNAPRRTAKALLETDRRLFLEENYNYKTALMRMDPWELSPKNDIIVAWKPEHRKVEENIFSEPDLDCSKDIEVTESQLLVPNHDILGSDWTEEEEREIQRCIKNYLLKTEGTKESLEPLIFPTGMGGRKRKLIHFIANKMKLSHWAVGSKSGDRTVAVGRRGKRKRNIQDESDSTKVNL